MDIYETVAKLAEIEPPNGMYSVAIDCFGKNVHISRELFDQSFGSEYDISKAPHSALYDQVYVIRSDVKIMALVDKKNDTEKT